MIRKKSLLGFGITAVFIVVATASAQSIDTAMSAYFKIVGIGSVLLILCVIKYME